MYYVLMVAIVANLKQLMGQNCSVFLVEMASFCDLVKQRTPANILSNYVDVLSIVEVLINAHDVWVVERSQNIDFINDLSVRGFRKKFLFNPLDCPLFLRFVVFTKEHFTE